MLVSQLASRTGYPRVQEFIVRVLDMQFADVRAMLQLPRPEIGIRPGCNFAIVSSLCNLISGISTTIFKPPRFIREQQSKCGAGEAFRGVVGSYFPYKPPGTAKFPKLLYELCRNPLAHSAGLSDTPKPVVTFARVFDASHPGVGWSDKELDDLEVPEKSFGLPHSGIVADGERWTVHCDSFYLDVIEMLGRLSADSDQMRAAEDRFSRDMYNWRR